MADTKITALTAVGTLATADLVACVDDTGGTPITKSATIGNFLTYTEANLSDIPAGVTVNGAGIVKFAGLETIWIPAAAMIASTTSGAATAQIETTTNKQNYKVFDFDATADEFVCFDVAFPKSWNAGTVTFQVFWESAGAVTTGIAMGLQGLFVADNIPNDTGYGTIIVVTDDAQSTAGENYVTPVSSAVTIAGTLGDDGVVNFRLSRDVSDANDDMTQDARVRGVKLFYTTDLGNDT